jgi:hypothetical protein
MVQLLKLLSAGTAIAAAIFWFWSAAIHIPDTLDMKLSGPESPAGYMKKQSKLSALAAAFAGVSAVAQAYLMWLQP